MIQESDYNWENISVGAVKYDFIMKRFLETDVSKDEEFQTRFTGFYRIRRNKELFLKNYYSYMESLKGKNVSFETIIKKVRTFKGSIEPSFSSKMLATLNPNMPAWDKYVLFNLGITMPKSYSVTIDKCIHIYNKIISFYDSLLNSSDAKKMIEMFDKKLPSFVHFTKIKKIDLMLWQKR